LSKNESIFKSVEAKRLSTQSESKSIYFSETENDPCEQFFITFDPMIYLFAMDALIKQERYISIHIMFVLYFQI
jgi:hypothetical protein